MGYGIWDMGWDMGYGIWDGIWDWDGVGWDGMDLSMGSKYSHNTQIC